MIDELRASGAASLRRIAAGLNAKSIKTARVGAWSAVLAPRVLEWAEAVASLRPSNR